MRIAEDADIFFDDFFTVEALWKLQKIRVHFDNAFLNVFSEVESFAPAAICKTSDVEGARPKDPIYIEDRPYTIKSVHRNDDIETVLILSEGEE